MSPFNKTIICGEGYTLWKTWPNHLATSPYPVPSTKQVKQASTVILTLLQPLQKTHDTLWRICKTSWPSILITNTPNGNSLSSRRARVSKTQSRCRWPTKPVAPRELLLTWNIAPSYGSLFDPRNWGSDGTEDYHVVFIALTIATGKSI